MRCFFATSNLHACESPRQKHERALRHNWDVLLDDSASNYEKLINALRLILHVVAVGMIVLNDIFHSTLSELLLNATEWGVDRCESIESRI